MSKEQVYVAKGRDPWFTDSSHYWIPWIDVDKIINIDESVSGQATVACKNVTDMSYMFNECSKLTSLDLSNFNTFKVNRMDSMFDNCSGLTTLDLSNFDTSNVIDMFNMFRGCRSLTTLDLSSFDTSKVTTMNAMFSDCHNLTSADLSSFDTTNVDDMSFMFDNCFNLTALDLSSFDTSKVRKMDDMFYGCSSLTTIKGIIDMKSCAYCTGMFRNCTSLKGVKIKNPPANFENVSGLSKSQYTIVDDESDSVKKEK